MQLGVQEFSHWENFILLDIKVLLEAAFGTLVAQYGAYVPHGEVLLLHQVDEFVTQPLVGGCDQLEGRVDQYDRLLCDHLLQDELVALVPVGDDWLREPQVDHVVQVQTIRIDDVALDEVLLQLSGHHSGLIQAQFQYHLPNDLSDEGIELLQLNLTHDDIG